MSERMTMGVPIGGCPKCGNIGFYVYQKIENTFITGKYGEILNSKEITDHAIGKCASCGKVYEMLPTPTSFIPVTPLRKILFEYSPHKTLIKSEKYKEIPNPMQKG